VKTLKEYAKVEITLKKPSDVIYVDADPVRLGQVFENLISNACKYTNAGGKIEIIVLLEGKDVAVRIKDSGIGIDKGMLSRIFDMFTQVDQSLERTRGGLGLGLAIVRSLVQLHGGTVEAFSAGLNCGSEFIVRIPTIESNEPRKAELVPAISMEDPEATPTRRILIADDNPDSAESLAMLLKLDGHEVRTAFDGIDAIAIAQEFLPEIAMLDIGMPRLNGYDAAREFRKASWGRNIILIALTGWGQENDLKNATQAGFNHHLVKPADIADIRRLISIKKWNR
jgi:CheY-like chemotaxis protein